MKILQIFISFLLIASCTNSNSKTTNLKEQPTSCDCNELLLDVNYNRYYLTDKKQPFTGHCVGYFPQTKIISVERDYVNGKYHGTVVEYFKNGKIKSTIEYKNNFMNGNLKNYNQKGELISHSIYKQSTLIEIIKDL